MNSVTTVLTVDSTSGLVEIQEFINEVENLFRRMEDSNSSSWSNMVDGLVSSVNESLASIARVGDIAKENSDSWRVFTQKANEGLIKLTDPLKNSLGYLEKMGKASETLKKLSDSSKKLSDSTNKVSTGTKSMNNYLLMSSKHLGTNTMATQGQNAANGMLSLSSRAAAIGVKILSGALLALSLAGLVVVLADMAMGLWDWISGLDESAQKTKEQENKLKELNAEMDESLAKTDFLATYNQGLADTYFELAGKQNLSKEESLTLASVTQELADLYPELADQLDLTKKGYDGLAEAMERVQKLGKNWGRGSNC